MKKFTLLLSALVSWFAAFASHDIGGSLEYLQIAPNTYAVTYSHYNWSGLAGLSLPMLKISSPGCNTGRQVPLTFVNQRPGANVPALGMVMPYKISEVRAMVVFTPAEIACNNILLSVTWNPGQQSASLTTGPINIYTEATLKLDQNSSLTFEPQNKTVLAATKFKPIKQNVSAFDPDGDSLVYRLVAPLIAYNQPVTAYKAITAPFINPNPQPPFVNPAYPQLAFLNGTSAYSPTFPIISYDVNWASGQPVCRADKTFLLNAQTGEISFTPMVFDPAGINTYVVSFQVDEYRKINGLATKIGSIRRETVIMVIDAGTNHNPGIGNVRVNNLPITQYNTLHLMPGNTLQLQLDAIDPDLNDSLYLTTNAASLLPGAILNINTASRQSAMLTWSPTAAQVRSQPYYLRIWVRDNAMPFAGQHVETIAIRVVKSGVSGVKPELSVTDFYVYPNPFSKEVNFNLGAKANVREIIIYNALGQLIDHLKVSEIAGNKAVVGWPDAAKFPAGTYFARLMLKDKTTQTIKFTRLQ